MPALSEHDHVELLTRALKPVTQSEDWLSVLNFIDTKLNCRSFLVEYDADGTSLPTLGGERQAIMLANILSDIETEYGKTAFQFLLSDASLLHPYRKTSLANGRFTASAPGQEESSVSRADAPDKLLRDAPWLATPVWRKERSSVLFGCLFIGRAPETIDTDQASATFRSVVRALMPGLNVHFQLEKQRLRHRFQQLLLSVLEGSAVLIDRKRDILAQTPDGLEILSELDIAACRRQTLTIKNKQLDAALKEHLSAFENGGMAEPKSILFSLAPEAGSLRRISLETVSNQNLPPGTCEEPLHLIRVTESKDPPDEIELCLQDHFDLSQSEAHLAWHLTMTGAMSTTVDDLGITRNTAKTHLRRIYEKTGVHTQLELARLVHRIARLF
ncbi:hypothetical protein LAB1_27850 [Roseibium sp. LAB1]